LKFQLHAKKGIVSIRHKLTTRGAYLLFIDLKRSQTLRVGSLGEFFFPRGRYAYVGSARGGISARLSRHKRLAVQKKGKLHWHIDYLLVRPHAKWAGEAVLEDGIECKISEQIAAISGAAVPVPGFGSSDCRAGCKAHLYLMPPAASRPIGSLLEHTSRSSGKDKS
jgi:Uri superfamily endonuclease